MNSSPSILIVEKIRAGFNVLFVTLNHVHGIIVDSQQGIPTLK